MPRVIVIRHKLETCVLRDISKTKKKGKRLRIENGDRATVKCSRISSAKIFLMCHSSWLVNKLFFALAPRGSKDTPELNSQRLRPKSLLNNFSSGPV